MKGKSMNRTAGAGGTLNRISLIAGLAAILLSGCGGGGSGSNGNNAATRTPLPVVFIEDDSLPGDPDSSQNRRILRSVLDDGTQLSELNPGVIDQASSIKYTISPNKQWVAFILDQEVDNVPELYVSPIAGGSLTKVSADLPAGRAVSQFQWSPDSKQLVYLADQDTDNIDEVYLVDRDGNNRIKINGSVGTPSPVVELFNPQWSPDGRYISQEVVDLATTRVIGVNIYDTSLGTPNSTRISNTVPAQRSIRHVLWAPDSKSLIYVIHQGSKFTISYTENSSALYHCDLGNPCVAINPPGTDVIFSGTDTLETFAWSASNGHLAYPARAGNINTAPNAIYVEAFDGSSPVKAFDPAVKNGNARAATLHWSSDGSYLAYCYRDNNSSSLAIPEIGVWTLADNTTNFISIPTSATTRIDEYRWSPLSNRIAFNATGDTTLKELYVSSPDGSDVKKVNDTVIKNIELYDWSPDGDHLAYVAVHDASDNGTLMVSTPDAAGKVPVSAPLVDNGYDDADPYIEKFLWSADSNRLVYLAGTEAVTNNVVTYYYRNFELFITAPDRDTTMKVATDLKVDSFSN